MRRPAERQCIQGVDRAAAQESGHGGNRNRGPDRGPVLVPAQAAAPVAALTARATASRTPDSYPERSEASSTVRRHARTKFRVRSGLELRRAHPDGTVRRVKVIRLVRLDIRVWIIEAMKAARRGSSGPHNAGGTVVPVVVIPGSSVRGPHHHPPIDGSRNG